MALSELIQLADKMRTKIEYIAHEQTAYVYAVTFEDGSGISLPVFYDKNRTLAFSREFSEMEKGKAEESALVKVLDFEVNTIKRIQDLLEGGGSRIENGPLATSKGSSESISKTEGGWIWERDGWGKSWEDYTERVEFSDFADLYVKTHAESMPDYMSDAPKLRRTKCAT